MELLGERDASPPYQGDMTDKDKQEDSIFNQDFLMRVASERGTKRQLHSSASVERNHEFSPPGSPGAGSCSTTILILVVHAGSVLGTKRFESNNIRQAFHILLCKLKMLPVS